MYECCKNTLLSDVAIDNGVALQEVAATAHDWQQPGEASATTAASPEGSAEPPANGQSEGSLGLLQAPAAQVAMQIPATEAVTASGSFLATADTTAEARSTSTAGAKLPTAEVAAGTDKAAAQATAGVPPAMTFASQHATPATMDSTAPEPARTAAAEATTGVPPAMTDASLDLEEEKAGGASEALAAGAPSGKGSEATASATISDAERRTGTEGKAAPDSPSDLSVVDAEHGTHATEGFSDDRAAADSPGADVWATTPVAKFKIRTTSRDPAAESEADTIAAKHAAEPAFTMPQDLPGSSSPQAYSKGQSAENKAAAQAASSAAAAATSSPAAQNDVKSFLTLTPTPTAAATAGSADADVPTSASAVSISGDDANMAALKSAGDRSDMMHPSASAVHSPGIADATAKSEAGVPASDQEGATPAVPTSTGTDATAGVPSHVQTAVQASLPTTTKSVSSTLPVDASEGISAEPSVCEAASSAVPASADHAAADAHGPVQSSTTSKSGSGSKGVTKWVVHPGDHRLEWPEDAVERQLSSGATAVVLRFASLAALHSSADSHGADTAHYEATEGYNYSLSMFVRASILNWLFSAC